MRRKNTASPEDGYSQHSVRLQGFFDTTELGVGSGVVVATKRGPLLLTALHNLTGRESDGRCKNAMAAIPNRVEIRGRIFAQGQEVVIRSELYENGDWDKPLYWRHPDGPRIDVVALPIAARNLQPLHGSLVDPDNHFRGVQLDVGQMCFIVGYPEGLFTKDGPTILPIWKTGHIASEPAIYHDDLPLLLIDAATCKGMSGSPVYVCAEGGH